MRKIAIVIAALAFQVTASESAALMCFISEKVHCAQGQGCKPVESKIAVRINTEQQLYSRCDAKGCDEYQAEFGVSGVFINIAVPKNGMLAKLSTDGRSFIEVVTLGTDVLISYGSCN